MYREVNDTHAQSFAGIMEKYADEYILVDSNNEKEVGTVLLVGDDPDELERYAISRNMQNTITLDGLNRMGFGGLI